MAGGHSGGSLVGHVVCGAWKKVVYAQVSHAVPVTCARREKRQFTWRSFGCGDLFAIGGV